MSQSMHTEISQGDGAWVGKLAVGWMAEGFKEQEGVA